jgi:hypothetical protein
VHDDGTGPALFVGGRFVANDSRDWYLAKWGLGGPDVTQPTLSVPTYVWTMDKLGSPPGEIVHFTVTASDCSDPSPTVVCVPPSGSLFPRGRTVVTCTATDASGNRSVSKFPVVVESEFLRDPSKVRR